MTESQSNRIGEQSPPEFVTLGALSAELSMDKSALRRWVIDQGVTWHKRRIMGSGGNALQAAIFHHEAELIRHLRRDAGYTSDGRAASVALPSVGVFYVIAIVPELNPGRLKFGFTDSLQNRLANHRTIAPTLQVLCTWPCRAAWERPAIECLGVICRLIGGEVYQSEDVNAVLARAEQFFLLLPVLEEETTHDR